MGHGQVAKVFWFFFSKKNRFPPLPHPPLSERKPKQLDLPGKPLQRFDMLLGLRAGRRRAAGGERLERLRHPGAGG